ncbi:MAG TPA: hypothetical protein VL463_08235 [Kofleriaceae bacterium]|nr:hypothetical protein [Kofleriaceae bacterium]
MKIVANFDCELEWAASGPLPARVRAKLAALGTLLRALAPIGDEAELVLLGPVDRARVPEIDGVRWRVASDPSGAELRWGAPASDVIRRVADRRFALALRDRLGVALGGTRVIDSPDALDGERGAWIAKAPITAAGRDRVRRRGAPDAETRTRLARLIDRHGALVVEPWLDRICDVGQSGTIGDQIELLPAHALYVDATGGFAGIAITRALPIDDAEHAQLREVARATGLALRDAGYRGPFTIDAFAYRDADGARRFHPLCEINPRLTFGFVARAWASRRPSSVVRRPEDEITLRVGEGAPPSGSVPLLLPCAEDPTAAWLEISGD